MEGLKGLAEEAGSTSMVMFPISRLEFKKAFGAEDAFGGLEMCIDHAATISTCMIDLQFVESCFHLHLLYNDAVKAKEIIEKVMQKLGR